MNDIFTKINHLQNQYFIMRHGKSKANTQQIIVSNPQEGTSDYGLVEEGRSQVKDAITYALHNHILNASTIIISSDFTRARETAEIAKAILQSQEITFTPALRERNFGAWEKTNSSNYQKVWNDDMYNSMHKNNNVESTQEVLQRTITLIMHLEKIYTDKKILLVSHGDTLQILQTAFEKVDAGEHRQLSHLQTAEIRELVTKP